MSRRLLLPIALALAIITPVLAEDPPAASTDSIVTQANEAKARAEALKAQYEAQKAEAEARFAPLSRFAGDGSSHIENGGGQMEAAYLAAVTMGNVAAAIDSRVTEYITQHPAPAEPDEAAEAPSFVNPLADAIDALSGLPSDSSDAAPQRADEPQGNGDAQHPRVHPRAPAPPPAPPSPPTTIVLLTDQEPFSFDAYSAFDAEARGIIHASVGVLDVEGDTCPVPQSRIERNFNIHFFSDTSGSQVTSAAGAVIGLLQSETHVYGFDQLGDDALLVSALTANSHNTYLRQAALLSAARDRSDPANVLLEQVADCEADLRAKIRAMPHSNDDEKAALAVVQAVLTRLTGFIERLTTPAADGSVRLAAVLRQSQLRRSTSPYVLRVHVNRAGGTMITDRNLWTALGAPAISLSGGVIASYSLTNRRTGTVLLGGTIICRTSLTGLDSAIGLHHDDLVCAENPPRVTDQNSPTRRRHHSGRRGDNQSVFRLADPQ